MDRRQQSLEVHGHRGWREADAAVRAPPRQALDHPCAIGIEFVDRAQIEHDCLQAGHALHSTIGQRLDRLRRRRRPRSRRLQTGRVHLLHKVQARYRRHARLSRCCLSLTLNRAHIGDEGVGIVAGEAEHRHLLMSAHQAVLDTARQLAQINAIIQPRNRGAAARGCAPLRPMA